MKKFFGEFKTFITRGNIVDMAVGVIVGGAFTGVVNGLSNFVLKPIINWFLALILGKDALSGLFTYLKTAYTVDADGKEKVISRFAYETSGLKTSESLKRLYWSEGSTDARWSLKSRSGIRYINLDTKGKRH